MKASEADAATIEQLTSGFDSSHAKGSRFLVAGGAGFLGSWLCDALISAGASVDCLDNLASGRAGNIDHLRGVTTFRFINSDLAQSGDWTHCDYDYVLHLASRASPEEYQLYPIETLLANSLGTRNLLEVARRTRATVLYASTSEIYGDPDSFPTPETYWGWVNPVGVRSCYDEGKRFGEALCVAYRKEYGMDVRIARIFNTYGPRMRSDGAYGRVVPRFIAQAKTGPQITVFGDGTQTRSFSYVTDTIIGLLKIVTVDAARCEIFNIGSPRETTILELARKIREKLGSRVKIAHGELPSDDPRRRLPDITKASQVLGWAPRVDLDEGLEKTIGWFARNS